MEESNPELESFRQQWRAEVSARSKADGAHGPSIGTGVQSAKSLRKQPAQSRLPVGKSLQSKDENEDENANAHPPQGAGNIARELSANTGNVPDFGRGESSQEPHSALEHYEKAVEKESQGSLGDSLNLYRKAFRMDSQVDLKYKSKHFPPSYFTAKLAGSNPSNSSATVPGTGHHSLGGPPQTIKDLLAGFQELRIKPAQPEIEGTATPPCPISTLPHEILLHILTEVAILDVASFVRLAQVCKPLAYIVGTEEQIWRRVCLGSEVGFGAMHYQWQRDIQGSPLEDDEFFRTVDQPFITSGETMLVHQSGITSEILLERFYSSSWQNMFRLRPRVRFNGCYISTVNYTRPGQASPSQITWNSPVHIVTYFRYLRFFRDGTVISLLSTAEPADVVRFLTKDLLETHKNGQGSHLPSAAMKQASRGRWMLSGASGDAGSDLDDAEGDVFIETEGVGKYICRMEFSLRRVGKSARNNRLVWKRYSYYSNTTDDWGEFGLRNEKAFFWSMVRSYGMGA